MTTKLDHSALRSALTSLGEGITVVSDAKWFITQSQAVQNTLIAGVIQNFEFVYEISIKMLRSAAEKGLITNVQAWFDYRKMRNTTAHTYDHERAHKVYQGTMAFLADATALLQNLEARNG